MGRRPHKLLRWYPAYDEPTPIDFFKEFAYEMAQEVANNPEGCTLPADLGYLKVEGNRVMKNLDINLLGQHAKRGKFRNYHTDQIVFKITWYSQAIGSSENSVRRKAFRNCELYKFNHADIFSKSVSRKIKAGEWTHFHMREGRGAPDVLRKEEETRKRRSEAQKRRYNKDNNYANTENHSEQAAP